MSRIQFPLISPEPLPQFNDNGDIESQELGEFSAVYEHGCGHIDSSTCLDDLLAACRRDGINVRFNERVEAFVLAVDGGKCIGVRIAGTGEVVSAGVPPTLMH